MKFFESKMRLSAPSDPGYFGASKKFNSLRKYYLILLLAVLALPVRTWGQTGETIYISTFSGNQILKVVDAGSPTVTVIYTDSHLAVPGNPAFLPEDIAVGPDGKVYVCDSIASRIWRLDPSTNAAVKIYDAATATSPNNPNGGEGPSFNSAGDLFFNTRNDSGPQTGIWRIIRPAEIPDGGAFIPVQIFSNAFFGEGTVFDSGSNLDFVNDSGNQVLQSSPPYTAENVLVSGGGNLNSPIGIAVNPQVNAAIGFGQNDIFVANSGLGNINHFSSAGAFVNTYATFTGPDFPVYMQFDASNNLFVVTVQTGSGGHGKVWRIPPSTAPATPILIVDLNTVFNSNIVAGLSSDQAVGLTVVLPPVARTPTSGALLTINGTVGATPVNRNVYDSQIHTGTVLTVPVGSGGSNCNANDQTFPTDAYVLQGGSWTGCDPGDAFELAQGTGKACISSSANSDPNCPAIAGAAYNLAITTQYLPSGDPTCTSTGVSPQICANPDTGFLTVTNNSSSAFSGTITLSGNSVLGPTTSVFCPANGIAPDSFTGNLAVASSVTLALSNDSSDCGGWNAPQTQTLHANSTNIFQIGKDQYQITPFNSNPGDQLTVLPVPVPAGPLGSAVFTSFPLGQFGVELQTALPSRFSAANFGNQACVPFADFSASDRDLGSSPIAGATRNPVCPELQLTCSNTGNPGNACLDETTFLYTGEIDFTLDPIVGAGIGGVHFLGQHLVPCPTTGFNIDALLSYTGSAPGTDPPGRISGSGKSCFVTTYEPAAPPVANGATNSIFVGFQSPVVNDPPGTPNLNLIKAGRTVPLKWQQSNSNGTPNINLSWCQEGPTVPGGPDCMNNGTPVIRPWVFLGRIPLVCPNGAVDNIAILTEIDPNSSGFQANTPGPGGYQFNWQTSKADRGCTTVVLEFDTGLTVFPANFQFTH